MTELSVGILFILSWFLCGVCIVSRNITLTAAASESKKKKKKKLQELKYDESLFGELKCRDGRLTRLASSETMWPVAICDGRRLLCSWAEVNPRECEGSELEVGFLVKTETCRGFTAPEFKVEPGSSLLLNTTFMKHLCAARLILKRCG